MSTRRLVTAVALAACLPSCGRAGAPTRSPAPTVDAPESKGVADPDLPRYDAETFYETLAVHGASFSHDESKLLITTDATGVPNVYAQPVAGGAPIPLTDSKHDARWDISYFPDDDRFLYASDAGGNELDHIYVVDPGGKVTDLTPAPDSKAVFHGWSRDKTAFFIATNERDRQAFDLYRYSVETYDRKLIFSNQKSWAISEIGPEGRYLALERPNDNRDTDLYLVDTKRKHPKPKLLSTQKEPAEVSARTFSPDGKKLYYGTDEHGEFVQVWSYDLASKNRKKVIDADWDVVSLSFSDKGKYRVSATNADARTQIEILDTTTGTPVEMPGLPAGDITGVKISRSETKMAFYLSGDRSPPNLYVLDLTTGEHRRLTDTLDPAIDADELVDGQVVRFESYDGVAIPSILYRPREASADNRVPAMLWIHGGPGGQSRLGYRAMIQHLVNHGYAVFAVNNRGSDGYGKTFHHLDDRKHGDADLDDCVAAKKYLQGLDWIDPERIGIMGGSYGGYMVLAALAFRPDEFVVGVDIFGVANWIRTLESIPPWWASFRKSLYAELGHPEVDRERLEKVSPLLHASNIRRPLFVVQGANDPRVLEVESEEIVAEVKSNGVPVEYVVFDDEGHGFRKRKNRIVTSERILSFLDKHMRASD